MSDPDPSSQLAPIPEGLKKQLADFQAQLWRVKVIEAVLAGIFGLLVSFLLVFLIDRFVATPPLVRLIILLAGTSLFGVFAPLIIRRWIYGHRREGQLARLIAKKYPKLGDRLLGVVELQDQEESQKSLSPELREAAMAHVARQAGKKDMTEALPISHYRKLAIGVGLAVFAVIIGFTMAPKAGSNALLRWLLPLSDTARYTFTQLDLSNLQSPHVVPYDEPFVIEIPLKEESDERPDSARARYGLQEWMDSELSENGSYRFEFAGQQAKDTLTLRAGDAVHRITIEPEIRPDLASFEARVELPDYLQLEPRLFDIRSGALSALSGSKITLAGSFSRGLARADATVTSLLAEEEPLETPSSNLSDEQALAPASALPAAYALKVLLDDRSITSAAIELGDHNLEIPFTWTDVKGLDGPAAFQLKIRSIKDQAPTSYLQGIERQVAILAGETLEFEVVGEDDFGLKELGLIWQGEFTKPSAEEPAQGSLVLETGAPDVTRLNQRAIFSPQTHGIKPQRLALAAYAQDYLPGREKVISEPIVVYILTPDEHAQMLKKRFDRLVSELEDAARREQNNLDINRRLDQQNKGEDLQKEEARRELAEQEDAEDQNAEKVMELAKKMEELFKDAARNESIDKDTMQKMSETMQNLKELGEQDLPEVEQKLNESQDEKSTAEKSKRDLQEAIEKQKEALKKMQETIEKANDANDNFEASTFINRLKQAASDENSIHSSLVDAMQGKGPKTQKAASPLLGSAPSSNKIDPVHERLLKGLGAQQKSTTTDIRWIQEDLGRFYTRTQKEIHKELFEEMKESDIDLKLEALQRRLEAHQTFLSAIDAQKWGRQLSEWAKKLEGDKSGGGGGGGGGEGGSPAEKDFEFMLKVMRMVQKEQDIRARTRSLEQLMRSVELRRAAPIGLPAEK
ncbi:MAG: hypothetical protein ACON4K_06260 [Akkermansiaceae bacterium]